MHAGSKASPRSGAPADPAHRLRQDETSDSRTRSTSAVSSCSMSRTDGQAAARQVEVLQRRQCPHRLGTGIGTCHGCDRRDAGEAHRRAQRPEHAARRRRANATSGYASGPPANRPPRHEHRQQPQRKPAGTTRFLFRERGQHHRQRRATTQQLGKPRHAVVAEQAATARSARLGNALTADSPPAPTTDAQQPVRSSRDRTRHQAPAPATARQARGIVRAPAGTAHHMYSASPKSDDVEDGGPMDKRRSIASGRHQQQPATLPRQHAKVERPVRTGGAELLIEEGTSETTADFRSGQLRHYTP